MTTMTKRQYAEEIAKRINGEVTETTKNNGVVFIGVQRKEGNIAPLMYIDEAYENGEEIEDMVKNYEAAMERAQKEEYDFEWLDDYAKVRERIKVKLINKSKNPGTEVYRSARGYGFPDLIIVPYIDGIRVGGHEDTTTVVQSMLDKWGVTKRTVIDKAIANMEKDVVVMPLANKLAELVGGVPEMFDSPFHIVTNRDGRYGAASIIKAKWELDVLFPDGYYVIPSSIHEMLVLPMEQVNADMLKGLIGEVNTEVLDAKDYLSDHPYEFKATA